MHFRWHLEVTNVYTWCILCICPARVNPPTICFFLHVCLCLLVTLYDRYRGRAAWQWCLPAPALLSRWNIPQSPWTGCPLRKTIWTQRNWEKCSLTHQTLYQMFSLVTGSCITICLTFATGIPDIICAQIRTGIPLLVFKQGKYANSSGNRFLWNAVWWYIYF